MNRFRLAVVAMLLVSLMAGPGAADPESAKAPVEASAPSMDLASQPLLYEITRHLYRWYIEERDAGVAVESGEVIFWVREVHPTLDEGDRSRFGEVVLPQFEATVKLKQADYTIPELDLAVKNPAFRIISVENLELPDEMPEGYAEIRMNYVEMRDELFRTRNQAQFPEGELLERLRAAVREEIAQDPARNQDPIAPKQVVYLAPLSPVANETWVYWETGHSLIQFTSDIDLTNPAVWGAERLGVRFFDMHQRVVVSLDEVSGSNAFLTRDQAGRALFNCVVLGRRLELETGVKFEAKDEG